MDMVIKTYPDPCLRQKAREIGKEEFSAGQADGYDLSQLGPSLTALMLASDGVGLAAPQVGIGLRVWVIAFPEGTQVVFNPVFTGEGEYSMIEGCLSLPNVQAKIDRLGKVRVTGCNSKGEEIGWEAEGIMAVAVQHETDHLDGVLFIDHVKNDYSKVISKATGLKGDLVESFITNRRRIAWKAGGDVAILGLRPMFLRIITQGGGDKVYFFGRKNK